jgi:hypothetical protein
MSKEQAKVSFQKAEKSAYPQSKDIYKFDKELSRYALWLQEFELRKELSDAANDSEILKKIGLDVFLSDEIKKEFISELAYILRYKRLNDIIYDAANRGAKTEKTLGVSTPFQTLARKVLTKAQMDAMVRYSLDTPYVLYHILKNNSFTDKYTEDEEDENKNQNFKTNKKKILIGQLLKSKRLFGSNKSAGTSIYLDENGKFVSGEETYTPLGMGSSGLRRNFLGSLNKKNVLDIDQKGIDDETQRNLLKKTAIKAEDEEKYQLANAATTAGTVALLGLSWWAFAAAAIGAGVWGGVKILTDKHGLPEWSVDGYLLKFITSREISMKIHNEAIIYFRKQTNEDKENLKVSYSIFCQNKSVPNRKSIKEVSKELLSTGGTRKLREKKSHSKTMRLY